MTCFELVNQMVANCARAKLDPHQDNCKVTLTEPDCPDSEATIFGVPQRAVVICLDKNFVLERVFRGNHGECKRCDFIIVAEKSNSIVIVYIEMKLTRDSKGDIEKQLYGARCFVRYMQELGKTFTNHKVFLDDAEHRFVSIKHTGSRKNKTKFDRSVEIHDTPETAPVISWPHHVEFAQLAGGN